MQSFPSSQHTELEIASRISLLRLQHRMSEKQLKTLLTSREIYVPLSICNERLSLLETVVKFLREHLQMKNIEIAAAINRDFRTISATYHAAIKKDPSAFSDIEYTIAFPLSVLKDRKLSNLESVVVYLHEYEHLSYHDIAETLHRNYQTIWTVARRAKQK